MLNEAQIVEPQSSSLKATLSKSFTLMKVHTWFAPAWAFMVGAIASHSIYFNLGGDVWQSILSIGKIAIGMAMAGPLLTGFSQVLNDYCDREVDAINQPDRLIPSGKVSEMQVFLTIFGLAIAALVVGLFLGPSVMLMCALGLALAISYSVHPLRFKRNGWIGNLTVAIAYEGLAWIAGHLSFQVPIGTNSLVLALVYSLGAHGIMTINDFKSVSGDRLMGIMSIPAIYGERVSAWIAVVTINLAQFVAIALLLLWGRPITAGVVALFTLGQWPTQYQLVKNPVNQMSVRYNMVAIPLYVWGMLAAAIGL
jgi:chlorophyll/bacteriochlorophyll a synthase